MKNQLILTLLSVLAFASCQELKPPVPGQVPPKPGPVASATPTIKDTRGIVTRASDSNKAVGVKIDDASGNIKSTYANIAAALATSDRIRALNEKKSVELQKELDALYVSLRAADKYSRDTEENLLGAKSLNSNLSKDLTDALQKLDDASYMILDQEFALKDYSQKYDTLDKEVSRLTKDNQRFYEQERKATKEADKNSGWKTIGYSVLGFGAIGFLLFVLIKGAKPAGL